MCMKLPSSKLVAVSEGPLETPSSWIGTLEANKDNHKATMILDCINHSYHLRKGLDLLRVNFIPVASESSLSRIPSA